MTAPLMDKSKLREEIREIKVSLNHVVESRNYIISAPLSDENIDQLVALTDSYYLGLLEDEPELKYDGSPETDMKNSNIRARNQLRFELRNRIGGEK